MAVPHLLNSQQDLYFPRKDGRQSTQRKANSYDELEQKYNKKYFLSISE
jgi:hypothetical protein